MSSDLINKLRHYAALKNWGGGIHGVRTSLSEAASEIEALKHDIERHLAITSEQAAEIERLTSLLVTCANELNRYEQ